MTIEAEKRRFGFKTKTETVEVGSMFKYIDCSHPIPLEVSLIISTPDTIAYFSEPAISIREISKHYRLPTSPLPAEYVQESERAHTIFEKQDINKTKLQIPGKKLGEKVIFKWRPGT